MHNTKVVPTVALALHLMVPSRVMYHMSDLLSDSPEEINARLRRRYIDRLVCRVKKLRRLIIERSWEDLRNECNQLATSGDTFGFNSITLLAQAAKTTIPEGRILRATTPIHAKEAVEALVSEIDRVLMSR